MGVRERILTIRLMEKVEMHPAYAGKLGIEVGNDTLSSKLLTDLKAVGQVP